MPLPGQILIVCTANICRSPMAEGLLAHALSGQPAPLKHLTVVSAGLAARPGELVSGNSVLALKKAGIDISGHRAQPLTQELLDRALVVFCMTESHRTLIQLQAAPVPKHLYLFRQFLPDHQEIPDPYGGSLPLYEACRDEMVEAIPGIVDFLRALVPAK
jgi:protein-tyrosine-phosphatase